MPSMNKALISAAGPNMAPMMDCAEPTFARYAEQFGYELIIDRTIKDAADYRSELNKAARWGRIAMMKEVLQDPFDLAVWFDADILITRFDRDIADDLATDCFQGFVWEQSPLPYRRGVNINGGVWPIRQDPDSTRFIGELEKIGMDATGIWADQEAMCKVLGVVMGNSIDGNFMSRPMHPSLFYDRTDWLPAVWNPTGLAKGMAGGRVIHYAGLTNEERLPLMQAQLAAMQDDGIL